jgi:hypothetical protein
MTTQARQIAESELFDRARELAERHLSAWRHNLDAVTEDLTNVVVSAVTEALSTPVSGEVGKRVEELAYKYSPWVDEWNIALSKQMLTELAAGLTGREKSGVKSAAQNTAKAVLEYLEDCSAAERWPSEDSIDRIFSDNFAPIVKSRSQRAKETAQLREELEKACLSTHAQAYCINQCAAHIGPETSATIKGLPESVKHLVATLATVETERDGLKDKAVKTTEDQIDFLTDIYHLADMEGNAGMMSRVFDRRNTLRTELSALKEGREG